MESNGIIYSICTKLTQFCENAISYDSLST